MPILTRDDLKNIKSYSLKERKSLVTRKEFGSPVPSDATVAAFLQALPKTYMAKDLLAVAGRIRQCKEQKKNIHFALGSHVIKNGLSPYLQQLMKEGFITALSFNGSALVHDFEIAFIGATSEDVDSSLGEGKFGLAKETAESLNRAVVDGFSSGMGLGKIVGQYIADRCPHAQDSLLAQAFKLGIPATIHIAVGTDITHIHPSFDPAKTAEASYRDFLLFASLVSDLEDGIYVNVGSAVILPEIFLKAISLARNLGHKAENFWAVNLDFIRHYRPRRNVLERPTAKGGRAIEIVGPHELLIPLLQAAIACGENNTL
ncbi:MAG: hypothetical protein HY537_09475 [Deltaproteobacteria bacterium]|nr:hypothetical protein [Deltaproteobacteria bacterium]